jgi:hypothetical protein
VREAAIPHQALPGLRDGRGFGGPKAEFPPAGDATTIGSKASDAEIAVRTVEIKEEIERIREQIQNVE